MPSIVKGFEYDIFISYRHKDNRTGWVTEFVQSLKNEIEATFKEDISIYFDSNPHDGLHETHDVDGSLKEKVKCLVFIPIVSQTYCDASSFAWQKEFIAFIDFAKNDKYGLDIKLPGGNVTKRILPVRIHEISSEDQNLFEDNIDGVMRPVDFIYKETGVNRPLKSTDDKYDNLNKTDYANQINKVANAIKDILVSLNDDTKTQMDSPVVVGSPFENKSIASEDTKRKRIQSRRDSFTRSIQLKKMLRISSWIALVALIGFGGYWFGSSSQNLEAKLQRIQFDFEIKTFIGAVPFGNMLMAISDDNQIICSTSNYGTYLKLLGDRSDPVLIPGTENGGFSMPFFSPDSKWIGLWDRSTSSLVKYPVAGGALRKICDVGRSYLDAGFLAGVNWHDNIIYFGTGSDIFRVEANGGKPELVYSLSDTTGSIVSDPQLLPDNNAILFTIYRDLIPEVVTIKLDDLDKPPVQLMQAHDIHYLSSGEVVFRQEERLYKQGFDLRTLQLTGDAQLIDTTPILVRGSRPPVGQFDLSNDILIYRSIDSENTAGNRQVVWIDQKGKIEPITRALPQFYYGPRISPDGTRIIVDLAVRGSGLKVAEVTASTGIFSLFTNGINPIWNPDGQSIIYQDSGKLFQKPLNLSYKPKLIFDPKTKSLAELELSPESLTKDARFLVVEIKKDDHHDIGFIDTKDKSIHMLDFINSKKREITPRLSPDDKWLAFSSDKDGTNQIYITSFPGPGTVYRVSAEKGYSPVWSPDMKYIYFVDGGHDDSKLYRSRIHIGKGFSSEEPEVLFKGAHVRRPNSRSTSDGIEFGKFDIHPNGQKFLMLNYASEIAPTTKVNVVVNWRQLK